VEVGGDSRRFWNFVNIDVKYLFAGQRDRGKAGFLGSFAKGGALYVGIVFDMPADLHPAVEPGVMVEQKKRAFGICHPGRCGHMADQKRPAIKVGVVGNKM